jgi:hypothetical protein
MSRVVRALALLAVSASALSAQVQVKSFALVTRLGAATPERAASLNSGGLIGLDAEYAFNKWFGLGTSVEVMRNNTHREDFLTRLRYGNSGTGGGDSIYYQYVGQAISTINVSAMGTLRLPSEKISPFLVAGIGNYTMIADAQVNGKTARQNDMSLTFGGGIWLKLADRVGMQLDVRALQFHGFERDFLNPAAGRREQFTPFVEDFPAPPAEKNTPMSTTFTLGFRYVPGGGGN